MEENNRKGPGIFYAVVGVATLVVAIIGATFAYFSATFEPQGTITGQTGSGISVGLVITEKTTVGDKKLIPLSNANQMDDALPANCIDANGNAVCKVYEIALTNSSDTSVTTKGTLELTTAPKTGSNMKWKLIPAPTGDNFADNASATANPADTPADLHKNVNGDALAAKNGEQKYYVVIWIEEAGDQNDAKDADLTFTGKVVFNAVDASGTKSTGLTATFK